MLAKYLKIDYCFIRRNEPPRNKHFLYEKEKNMNNETKRIHLTIALQYAGYEDFEPVTVQKNGKKLHGFKFLLPGNIAPVVYYDKNTCDEDYVERVQKALENIPDEFNNTNYLLLWDSVKSKIFLGVCNETRKDDGIIYRDCVSDVLQYVYIEIGNPKKHGKGVIRVNSDLLLKWGIDENTLFETAKENTFKKGFPVQSMGNFMQEMTGATTDELENGFYIISNPEKANGACVLAFPDFFKDLKPGKYYILPSSRHEVLLLSGNNINSEEKTLCEMVREVNTTEVSYDDFLSDFPIRLIVTGDSVNFEKVEM